MMLHLRNLEGEQKSKAVLGAEPFELVEAFGHVHLE
jgi:hypothetical protein